MSKTESKAPPADRIPPIPPPNPPLDATQEVPPELLPTQNKSLDGGLPQRSARVQSPFPPASDDADAGDYMLVRIKPSNNRERHVAHGYDITKTEGWCRVPRADAKLLKKEPMNDRYPESAPKVFDVLDEDEARELEEYENLREAPAGTTTAPRAKAQNVAREATLPPRNRRG